MCSQNIILTDKTLRALTKGEHQFRYVVDENNALWFIAKDVRKYLGWGSTSTFLATVNPTRQGTVYLPCSSTNGEAPYKVIDRKSFIDAASTTQSMFRFFNEHADRYSKWSKWVVPSILEVETAKKTEIKDPVIDGVPTSQLCDLLKQSALLIERLESRLDELESKALFADATESSSECVNVAALARKITDNGRKFTRNSLFAQLREDGFLSSDESTWNQPTKTSLEQGLFSLKTTTTRTGKGGYKTYTVPLVTGKGQVYLVNRYCGEEA